MLGLHRDNGQEYDNYYNGLGFRGSGFKCLGDEGLGVQGL